jgi:hypothetical protein
MNLTAEIRFAIDDAKNTQQHIEIHYALIGNQLITDLLRHIVREINKFTDALWPCAFPFTVIYLWNDFNDGRSTATFTSLILIQLNHAIV